MKEEALEVLKNRRAIRKFKDQQITDEELDAVLEAGTYAPTGMGTQDPVIVAVQDPEMRRRVSELNSRLRGRQEDPYYGAPTILIVLLDNPYDEEIGILDAGAVTTNLLNAAYAVGLGSCWINRPKEMFATPEGKQFLREWGLSENLRGVSSVALGYPDCEHPQAKKRKENYIVKI